MLTSNTKIHIVGGSGAMGTWLRKFLESLKFDVTISDEKIEPVDLEYADIVFISVPISHAANVITQTAKKISSSCLIVDLSSIKTEVKDALKKSGHPALSLHFLFGPSVSAIQNQKIISEKFSGSKIADDLLQLFKNEGAQIIEMDSDMHDLTMAHIQSLTHFINLSLAQILIKNKLGLSGQISTPVFLSQLSSTLKVLSQNPKLLSEIQTLNPKFLTVLEDYLQIQTDLIKKIRSKDVIDIENQFTKLRESLESVSGKIEPNNITQQANTKKPENYKVGFLGPKGTFSNQAALRMFDDTVNQLLPVRDIYDLFDSLKKDKVDLIVAPVENTIEGTVRETLDLLFDHDFRIIGKIDLPISQCLLSKEKNLTDIRRVISHPQAINQSRKFLEESLPQVTIETSSSTISSVTELELPGVAIIGPKLAAKIYGLNILKEDIQESQNNVTRFNIIAKRDLLNLPGRTKTLLFLSVFNRVGVLRDILGILADLSINLNKIESRPSKEKHWDYYFYVEVESTEDNPKLQQALDILKQYCPKIIVLGKL
jgi:chorismate mutase/prephenate dehydratase